MFQGRFLDRKEEFQLDANLEPFVVGGGARLLVADDDLPMRQLIASRLLDEGYEVYEAASGDALLRALQSSAPEMAPARDIDLVVTDIRMPGISGLEVVRRLRESRWTTPVVLMTAFPDAAVIKEAKRLRTSLLRKPFPLSALVEAVISALLERTQHGHP